MLGNDTLPSRQRAENAALELNSPLERKIMSKWLLADVSEGTLAEQPPPSPVAGRETSSRSRAVARGRAFHQQQPRLLYFLIIYFLFFFGLKFFLFHHSHSSLSLFVFI
jgi:hypothetical protein